MFKLGLIVNPLAGLGGPLAMKGSDGLDISAVPNNDRGRAGTRALRCLAKISEEVATKVTVFGFEGDMSANSAGAREVAGLPFVSVGCPESASHTTSSDTQSAALALSASLKKNIAFRKAGDSGALGAFADRSGGVSGRVLFGTRCLCQSGSADGFG